MMKIFRTDDSRSAFSLFESAVCIFLVSAVFVSAIEVCKCISSSTKKAVCKLEDLIRKENMRNVQKESFFND